VHLAHLPSRVHLIVAASRSTPDPIEGFTARLDGIPVVLIVHATPGSWV
jgi:hypothetical protein